MGTLRRWTSSVISSFDWIISQVENHEALVNSALKDVQVAGARARTQLTRVKHDGEKMRLRLKELHEQEDLWAERAVKSSELDQQKALECVKRRKRVQKEIAELEVQEREHARLEKQLQADLLLIDQKLNDLKRQRNLLRTRQSRAEALKTLRNDDSLIISELDDIFERWESKVSQYEIQGECLSSNADELENEFTTQEGQTELQIGLEELLTQRKQNVTNN